MQKSMCQGCVQSTIHTRELDFSPLCCRQGRGDVRLCSRYVRTDADMVYCFARVAARAAHEMAVERKAKKDKVAKPSWRAAHSPCDVRS
eukprot:3309898-Rhodomonas_salina.1